MQIDVDTYTAPVSADAPAGPDLGYDPARQTIEAAFEKSVSADEAEAEIDWDAVIELICQQAAATRDVWLAVYLMRAGAKAGRLETVESGANLLAGLLESLWDSVHPQLEEYGFQGRKAPCELLTRIGEFLAPLRKVILIEHPRLGRYNGADFDRFRDSGSAADGYGMFRALIEETGDERLQEIVDRIAGIDAAIRRADAMLTANAGDETGTNFQATYEAIELIRKSVAAFMKTPAADAEGEAAGAASLDSGPREAMSSGGVPGAINSREDVMRAIDAIGEYYARERAGKPGAIRLAPCAQLG